MKTSDLFRFLFDATVAGTVTLRLTGLPPSVTADEALAVTLGAGETKTQQLSLKVSETAAPGSDSFVVIGTSPGIAASELELALQIRGTQSVVTAILDPPQANAFNQAFKLSGSVSSPGVAPSEFAGAEVLLRYVSPAQKSVEQQVTTDGAGNFRTTLTPGEAIAFGVEDSGNWQVTASWSGNQRYDAAEREMSFPVDKGISALTLISEPTEPRLGTQVHLSGQLTPAIESATIRLQIRSPSGFVSTAPIVTDREGLFSYELLLDKPETWEITAVWEGNALFNSSNQTLRLQIPDETDKTIVVLGGGDSRLNPAWTRFNGLLTYVYRTLKDNENRTGQDIYVLSPEPSKAYGGGERTSFENLRYAITTWAKERVNRYIPLNIYLLSHGDEAQFLLERTGTDSDVYLTPEALDGWLSVLPEGTPVRVIIEACYSGSFLQNEDSQSVMKSKNLTLITSSDREHKSAILPNLSSFSYFLFHHL